MYDKQSLSHTVWECKYHAVWIPKYRKKVLYTGLRKHLGEIFRDLAEQKECKVLEGHLCSDHVHMLIAIPPKYAVSKVVEVMKSVTSMRLKEKFPHFLKKVYWDDGEIWARGFFVSTVGVDEEVIKRYVKYQGQQDAGQTKFEW